MFCGLRANELAVTAKIIGTGTDSRGNQICRVLAEVKNLSGHEITVGMMSCSWYDSWSVMPEDVFSIPGWECAKNIHSIYAFPAGGGFIFHFDIGAPASAGKIEGKTTKVGFRFLKLTWGQLRKPPQFELYNKLEKESPVVWSSEITIPKIENKALEGGPERIAAAKLPVSEKPIEKTGLASSNSVMRRQADGRSFETAVALEAKTQAEGVAAQYAWIEKNLPGAHLAPALQASSYEGIVSFGQEVIEHNGKLYSVLHLQLPDGKLRDVHFDISGYVGK